MWNQDEAMKEVDTIEEMRHELFKQGFHSPLVRNVFDRSDLQGLNGEDRYTLLSYYLLQENKRQFQLLLDQSLLTPRQIVITDPDKIIPDEV